MHTRAIVVGQRIFNGALANIKSPCLMMCQANMIIAQIGPTFGGSGPSIKEKGKGDAYMR